MMGDICKCEIYSRVVGYLSPISEWNKGKKEEFDDRQTYDSHIERSEKLENSS